MAGVAEQPASENEKSEPLEVHPAVQVLPARDIPSPEGRPDRDRTRHRDRVRSAPFFSSARSIDRADPWTAMANNAHPPDRDRERSLAVFIDLENLAMGFQNQRKTKFDIQKVLERLVEKGKLIVKKAYADWSRYQAYTVPFHESAIELIEIPRRSQTGKNSADIRLVVDAMDLSWSKPHVDTFVIVSGDSDFSPLVSKLKENGKHVIGLGMKGSTSELLRDNCDEFIYYEDLERQEEAEQKQVATNLSADLPDRKRELYSLLLEACSALTRENHEVLYASMIKDTIKRKKPSFDETYYGFRSFTHVLEDADNLALIDIERNPKSGTYVVTRFGERPPTKPVVAEKPPTPPPRKP